MMLCYGAPQVVPVIIEHLERCHSKEVGQHAERSFACVNAENAAAFAATFLKRRDSLVAPQRERVDRLLKRIGNGDFGK